MSFFFCTTRQAVTKKPITESCVDMDMVFEYTSQYQLIHEHKYRKVL